MLNHDGGKLNMPWADSSTQQRTSKFAVRRWWSKTRRGSRRLCARHQARHQYPSRFHHHTAKVTLSLFSARPRAYSFPSTQQFNFSKYHEIQIPRSKLKHCHGEGAHPLDLKFVESLLASLIVRPNKNLRILVHISACLSLRYPRRQYAVVGPRSRAT